MMKRTAVAVASCLALAACGGDSGGNAAAGKTFAYGTAVPVNSSQSYALDAQVSGALALTSAPDATSAQGLAAGSGLTADLFGPLALGSATASPTQQRLLAIGARAASRQLTSTVGDVFDNPACVTTTLSSVTMKGCTLTQIDVYGTSKIQLDGSVSFDQAKGTLTWSLTVTDAYSGQSMTASMSAHESGTLTVTDTTIKGQILAELSASTSSAGQSASMGVAEAVTLDLTSLMPRSARRGSPRARSRRSASGPTAAARAPSSCPTRLPRSPGRRAAWAPSPSRSSEVTRRTAGLAATGPGRSSSSSRLYSRERVRSAASRRASSSSRPLPESVTTCSSRSASGRYCSAT